MDAKKSTELSRKLLAKQQPGKIKRFRAFIERHRLVTILICGVLLIFIGGATAFHLTYQPPVVQADHTPIVRKKKTKPTKFYSQLNGIEVADETAEIGRAHV